MAFQAHADPQCHSTTTMADTQTKTDATTQDTDACAARNEQRQRGPAACVSNGGKQVFHQPKTTPQTNPFSTIQQPTMQTNAESCAQIHEHTYFTHPRNFVKHFFEKNNLKAHMKSFKQTPQKRAADGRDSYLGSHGTRDHRTGNHGAGNQAQGTIYFSSDISLLSRLHLWNRASQCDIKELRKFEILNLWPSWYE